MDPADPPEIVAAAAACQFAAKAAAVVVRGVFARRPCGSWQRFLGSSFACAPCLSTSPVAATEAVTPRVVVLATVVVILSAWYCRRR